MGVHTTVTISRGGNPVVVSPNPTVQIDTFSPHEEEYRAQFTYQGTAPHIRYLIYVQPLAPMVPYDIRYRDLLTDTVNIDQSTGNLMDYRVVDFPESFSDGHLEVVADHKIGT